MGDSLFNYKARHTDIHDGLLAFAVAVVVVVLKHVHGTLIRIKIENSIVQFNKFNFHCAAIAKLPNLPSTLSFIDFARAFAVDFGARMRNESDAMLL